MSVKSLEHPGGVRPEMPVLPATAAARDDDAQSGAQAPDEAAAARAVTVAVFPSRGRDIPAPAYFPRPGNHPPRPEPGALPAGKPDHGETADILEAMAELDGFAEDPDADDPETAAPDDDPTRPDSAGPAYEGAGVTVDRAWRFGPPPPRTPAIPREDAIPDPVTPRRRMRQTSEGRFRRNLSVDEAIAELAKPFEEPSPAERAAAMLRAKRPAKPGAAMRPPPAEDAGSAITPQQRLLLLDTWTRSGLPAGDFSALVGVTKNTLYSWKRRFEESGPAGLEDAQRGGPKGNKMPEVTRRAILMIKQAHPEYGCERISDLLARGPALPASASAVARVLKEAGYEAVERPTERHAPPVRRFERAKPNALWQTDLFTFVLKRQNRRLYMVVFMDDHSRFITGWGLFSSPSTEWVVAVLKEAVASCQAPEELLTDNGPQYVTWRGSSKFSDACRTLGIKQIVAHPRRPQTLGKVERFWGTLWREFLAAAIFEDGQDARHRIGRFIEAYNYDRPHQGMKRLTPAERYFGDAVKVKAALERRLAENARRLAAGLEPITGDASPPLDDAINEIPEPGRDALTAGLSAAAGIMAPGTAPRAAPSKVAMPPVSEAAASGTEG